MRQLPLLTTVSLVAIFLSGCAPQADDHLKDDFAVVGRNVKDTSDDMKDYNFSEKDEFVRTMQIRMDGINHDLDQLSLKIEKSDTATQAEDRPKLKVLRDQTLVLNQQLAKAKTADSTAWEDLKSGFKKGFADLKTGIIEARQWTSDKIAP